MTTHRTRAFFATAILSAFIMACAKVPSPRTVDVPTSDGVVLKATVFAAAKPGPAVLLLHQCDEQRKVWDSLGVKLMRAGITAVSMDYRGYGESGGTPHDKIAPADFEKQMAELWPSDIDSAYALLLRQPGVDSDRIGIAGGSCSVNNAVRLAARRSSVKALTLLAGPLDYTNRVLIAMDSAPPLLLGAAADDKYSNFVELQGWYGALSSNKQTRLVEYPDGGHAAMVFNKHPAFADTIAQWFSAVLRNKPELLPTTNGHLMSTDAVATLRELDRPTGIEKVGQQLLAARKTNPAAQLFRENYANQIGYDYVVAKDLPSAIAIMTLNTVAFPNSPNAQDSLGDVYLAVGDSTNAKKAVLRAIELLKADTVDAPERINTIRASAEGKLKLLGGK